jgi:hypothetical protein
MTLALSILDQSTVASGLGPAEAIRETLALARLADGWGYRRYWLAEHHNSASHAGTAPEILIAAIAAQQDGEERAAAELARLIRLGLMRALSDQ